MNLNEKKSRVRGDSDIDGLDDLQTPPPIQPLVIDRKKSKLFFFEDVSLNKILTLS